ncbi:MAG: hypothetical protein ACI9BD_000937, partial [Candidatus Marinamargulisbacteria bacterium]
SNQDCQTDTFTNVFAGNELLNGMKPYAMCYGGHQFGHWAGQLGDGRAINLGEYKALDGQRWTFQLKGPGITPYSRGADGLAVLRSSVREFLCSEAMFHLGVPTTRALSLVLTGEDVLRDMFYDGHPKMEPGAIVCRLAPSFLRFGNFEIHHARNEKGVLEKLANFAIENHFPDLGKPSEAIYLSWFKQICTTTADMIVHWMRVGFVHGVMNTDNMSILGLTIDYGPYGWVEDFDLNWTPNTTDAEGRRYCFGRQTDIAMWNLSKLAQAISPLIKDTNELDTILDQTHGYFRKEIQAMMLQKLGIDFDSEKDETPLVEALVDMLQLLETDMTLFFRHLADFDLDRPLDISDTELIKPLEDCYYDLAALTDEKRKQIGDWLSVYQAVIKRLGISEPDRRKKMNAVNPKYVLRNYLAQLAIDKATKGDFSEVAHLLNVLRNPYSEQTDKDAYCQKRPEWARNSPGCSTLSCSS